MRAVGTATRAAILASMIGWSGSAVHAQGDPAPAGANIDALVERLLSFNGVAGAAGFGTVYFADADDRPKQALAALEAAELGRLREDFPNTDLCQFDERSGEFPLDEFTLVLRVTNRSDQAAVISDLRASGQVLGSVALFWNGGGSGSYTRCNVTTLTIFLRPGASRYNTIRILDDSRR